jgi:hypothetical protein
MLSLAKDARREFNVVCEVSFVLAHLETERITLNQVELEKWFLCRAHRKDWFKVPSEEE